MGDIDMSIACWVNVESGTGWPIVCKWQTAGNKEYALWTTGNVFKFFVSGDGVNNGNIATWGSAWVTGTWYFIVAYHDAVANVVGISVDGGAAITAAHTTGIFNGASRFGLGDAALLFGTPKLDGLIDEVGIWKRVLSGPEITQLYNGGAGLAYPFTSAAKGLPVIAHWHNEMFG